jgi:uncharacterized protein YcbK (DUF882 family)
MFGFFGAICLMAQKKVSDYIYRAECECGCGCGQCIENIKLFKMFKDFCVFVDKNYKHGIKPIVHSINRCPAYNKKEGGTKTSKHLKGMAVDFHIYRMSIKKLHLLSKKVHYKDHILNGGLGFYKWGLHIDVGKFRTWGKAVI